MRVTSSSGRTVNVFISHIREGIDSDISGVTHAYVEYDEGGTAFKTSGRAWCLKPDNFCKATGLRIALERALRDTTLTKTERAAIWNKLWNGKYGKKPGPTSTNPPTNAGPTTASPVASSPTTRSEPPTRL